MSADAVDRRDLVDELPDATRSVRYVPHHARPGQPESVVPCLLALLAAAASAGVGVLLFVVILT